MPRVTTTIASALVAMVLASGSAHAQTPPASPAGTFLLTIFFKHDQSRLREVNRAVEQTAWAAYRTEFYPTYDYKAIGEELHRKAQ